MARMQERKYISASTTLTPEMIVIIESLAKSKGISRAEIIRALLEEGLKIIGEIDAIIQPSWEPIAKKG